MAIDCWACFMELVNQARNNNGLEGKLEFILEEIVRVWFLVRSKMDHLWFLHGYGSRCLGCKKEQQVWVVWAKEARDLELGFLACLS
jgi:hypothetical protein